MNQIYVVFPTEILKETDSGTFDSLRYYLVNDLRLKDKEVELKCIVGISGLPK